jgi:hypothetical protein
MFQKSIEAIIAQGIREIEALKKQAAETASEAVSRVERTRDEIQSLVDLAKQVPDKVFDRYSNVLVGTFEEYHESPQGLYAHIRLASCETQLRGLMGDERIKQGKYRVIVLLEPIS